MSEQTQATAAAVLEESIDAYMDRVGERARQASRLIAAAQAGQKNRALTLTAKAIRASEPSLREANAIDLQAGREKGLESAMLDRLELTPARIEAMARGLEDIAALPEPVGAIFDLDYLPSGLQVGKMRVPLGVVGIIYESRPNVTADAAGLCLKSGNATILRGGSEALHSNQAIARCVHEGLCAAQLPSEVVQVINTRDRAAVGRLITMSEYVDVLIPRGGKGLIERISGEASIPVIKHLDGVCHVYIDARADPDKAHRIALNAKTQRYGTCNTLETLLVDVDVAESLLPGICAAYIECGVELRGCARARALVTQMLQAHEQDWSTEYLAPILSIRIVDGLDAAIDHINRYGSAHTDAIVTEDFSNARRFLREVDSSSVMVNASTRFADGFEYGLGAEIGISTDKLHARGPVGLQGLTSVKYIVLGDGHVRE